MSRLGLLVSIGVIGLATGAFGAVQSPTLVYKSMDVAYIGAEGFTFDLNIEIQNPNSIPLPLGETTYSLKFGTCPSCKAVPGPAGRSPRTPRCR